MEIEQHGKTSAFLEIIKQHKQMPIEWASNLDLFEIDCSAVVFATAVTVCYTFGAIYWQHLPKKLKVFFHI